MGTVNLSDVQGLIIRGYGFDRVRHFLVQVGSPIAARKVISDIVSEDSGDGSLRITSAGSKSLERKALIEHGDTAYALNVAFTYAGLDAIGLPKHSLDSFQDAAPSFSDGAKRRAPEIGDIGLSAPAAWKKPFDDESKLHMLWSLYANDETILEEKSKQLKALFGNPEPALTEVDRYDGEHLTSREYGRTEHFGFRDGIEQPEVEGVTIKDKEDGAGSRPTATGAFLLGYPSQWGQFEYPLPTPAVLGFNGSFAAFRVLAQDVEGFTTYAKQTADKLVDDVSAEQVAAKMFGRWQNGAALDLYPDQEPDGDYEQNFDYSDDPEGMKCPVGAHIRRANPRQDPVGGNEKGAVASKRRIIRRGVPYTNGDDKGLLGLFICASLGDQFEFLMKEWMNRGGFNGHLPVSTRDPVIGANNKRESHFCFYVDKKEQKAPGLPAFVETRGGMYCFYPSMSGLRYIASLREDRSSGH